MAEKIQQIANKSYGRERTATLIHLLKLGIQAFEEGKEVIAQKYDLPEDVSLAIDVEVGRRVMQEIESHEIRFNTLQQRLEYLEDQFDRKNRKKNSKPDT